MTENPSDYDDFSAYDRQAAQGDAPAPERDLLAEELVARARYIYEESTDYFDTNVRNTWEDNLAHFRSEHRAGSKYTKDGYKRSKLFRPKTRNAVRHLESGLAAAAFSTQELVAVSAEDPNDPIAVANADINKALMQYRLEKTLSWFLTCIGAYQDTLKHGVCVSHQYWDVEREISYVPEMDDDGLPMLDDDGQMLGREDVALIKDQPAIDLIPPENLRFSPAADWRTPLQSSPYVIHMMPMFYNDVKAKMDAGDWRQHPEGAIRSAKKQNEDSTRSAREGRARTDSTDADTKEFEVIWVHRNIVRIGQDDYVYLTLGTEFLLTEPAKLTELYPHLRRGERPYVLGISNLETHRNYPAAVVELGAPIQDEINEITNQRIDNVRLVLNKRYFVRRGANVDLSALMRNTPGGGVLMTDPSQDVNVINTPDVTSSSYEEHDRLSVEHDELMGNFSQQSVSNNRSLNETVGGMNLMSMSSNEIQDYSLRLFIESWMEPVLRQLSRLEAYYETDATILRLAGESAKIYQRFGVDKPTDDMLLRELSLTVNIGLGFTNPQKRVERLLLGINSVINLPTSLQRLKPDEVEKEIFGALGYKNGSRFFMSMEEFEKQSEGQEPPKDPRVQAEEIRAQVSRENAQMQMESERYRVDVDYDVRLAKFALDERLTLAQLRERLQLDREKELNKREIKALDMRQRNNEMVLKQRTGSGI